MRVIFFGAVLAIGTFVTACKKDKNGSAPAQLPGGQYRLIEMHQADSTGIDSAGVAFNGSSLSLTFDEASRSAKLAGKAEAVNINGGYKVDGDVHLTDAKIASTKVVATANDLAVIQILNAGQSFVHRGLKVILQTKDKGYLVFSMQK